MRLLLLFAVSACGFAPAGGTGDDVHPGDARRDAPTDGPPDAPPDAAATWQLIDTIVVPCSGTTVKSTASLSSAGTYHVRATGECVVNTANGSMSDAEYFGYNVNQFADVQSGVDNGISIDNSTLSALKYPRWGAYTDTHSYEVPWIGLDDAISTTYFDSNYPNNSGSITLQILIFK